MHQKGKATRAGISIALTSIIAATLASPLNGSMPSFAELGITSIALEQAVRTSNCAFVGNLQCDEIEQTEALWRIVPTHSIWGKMPVETIQFGRRRSDALRTGGARPPLCKERNCGTPIMVVARDFGQRIEVLYFIGSDRWDGGKPITDDLVAVRVYEHASNTPELRRELMKVIADPDTPELLWEYAIRRLYRMGRDHWERVSLLTDPAIQRAPRPEPNRYAGRLEYATSLLIGEPLWSTPDWVVPQAAELTDFYSRLGEIFGSATTDYMAQIALSRLAEDSTRRLCWGASDWGRILAEIRIALIDPAHPIYRVPTDYKPAVNDLLESLFDRPNMLDERPKSKNDQNSPLGAQDEAP